MATKASTSNFWFGFALGTLSAVGGAYLLGTQSGREKLKKLVESAEQWDNDPDKLAQMIKGLIPQSTEATEPAEQHKIEHMQSPVQSIASILEKVKDMTKDNTTNKKFFNKTDK